MAKVKLILEVDVDLPVTTREANKVYGGTLFPLEAFALDKISGIGIHKLISSKEIIVKDVIFHGTV